MIEVDITLNIHGLGLERKRLGRVVISNDGTGSPTRGNYNVRVYDRLGTRVVRRARVEGWPRQSKTATQLLAAALREAYG